MHAQLLPAEHFQRMRWLNGAGWTREIHRSPAAQEDFDWRASIAEISADGPFSPFPGCRREQVLLGGNGLTLAIDGAQTVTLQPPHDGHGYSGDAGVTATLIDGPVQVFNLILRSGRVDARVLLRPLVGAMLFFPEPHVDWLIYLITGRARLHDDTSLAVLSAGDALLLTAHSDTAGRRVLDGAGSALLCRIERVLANDAAAVDHARRHGNAA